MGKIKLTPEQQEYLALVDQSLDFINSEIDAAIASFDTEDVTGYSAARKKIAGMQKRYDNELKNFINWCIANKLPLTRDVKDLL
jgi:hypothetical protein